VYQNCCSRTPTSHMSCILWVRVNYQGKSCWVWNAIIKYKKYKKWFFFIKIFQKFIIYPFATKAVGKKKPAKIFMQFLIVWIFNAKIGIWTFMVLYLILHQMTCHVHFKTFINFKIFIESHWCDTSLIVIHLMAAYLHNWPLQIFA